MILKCKVISRGYLDSKIISSYVWNGTNLTKWCMNGSFVDMSNGLIIHFCEIQKNL